MPWTPRVLLILPLLLALAPAAPALAADQPQQIPQARDPATPPPPPPPEEPATPPAVQEAAEWYVSPKGQALGPFTLSQLRDMAAQGQIDGGTAVWKQGMADWARLRDVAELADVLVAAAPKADKAKAPPAAPSEQDLLDQEFKAYLAGTWYLDGPMVVNGVYYHITVETTYRPDGTFAGRQTVHLPSPGGGPSYPYVTAYRGTWQVIGQDASRFVLMTISQNEEPKRTALEVLDQNRLRNVDLDIVAQRVR